MAMQRTRLSTLANVTSSRFNAGLLLLFTEAISRIVYRKSSQAKPAPILRESFNLLKIGITYSLFLEAFKIGS